MDTLNYKELEQLSETNPMLDSLSFYFLGICSKYTDTSMSLERIIKQLPFDLSNIKGILKADNQDNGLISRALTSFNHDFNRILDLKQPSKIRRNLTKAEEDAKYWFQDFNLLQTLYPKITKNQWFYLGSFIASQNTTTIYSIMKKVYIEFLLQRGCLSEQEKVESLVALLNTKSEENNEIINTKLNMNQVPEESQIKDIRYSRERRNYLLKSIENNISTLEKMNRNARAVEHKDLQDISKRIYSSKTLDSENERPYYSREKDPRASLASEKPKEEQILQRKPLENLLIKINEATLEIKEDIKPFPMIVQKVEKPKEGTEKNSGSLLRDRIKSKIYDVFPKSKYHTASAKNFLECSICFESMINTKFTVLDTCKHAFHSECLKQYFYSRIDDMNFPITCPMEGCSLKVSENKVLSYLCEQYKTKYHSFQLKHFMLKHSNDIVTCPTPNCEYFSFKVEGNRSFYCWTCSKAFCISCKAEWHDGLTCEENEVFGKEEKENDEKFREFVRDNSCQMCPKCNFYVHKTEGCKHITCFCKHEFCYICGLNMDECYCE